MIKRNELTSSDMTLLSQLNIPVESEFKTVEEHNKFYNNIAQRLENLERNLQILQTAHESFFIKPLNDVKTRWGEEHVERFIKNNKSYKVYLNLSIQETIEVFHFLLQTKHKDMSLVAIKDLMSSQKFSTFSPVNDIETQLKDLKTITECIPQSKTTGNNAVTILEEYKEEEILPKSNNLKTMIDKSEIQINEIEKMQQNIKHLKDILIEKSRQNITKTFVSELVDYIKAHRVLTDNQIQTKLDTMITSGAAKQLKPLVKKLHESIHNNERNVVSNILFKIFYRCSRRNSPIKQKIQQMMTDKEGLIYHAHWTQKTDLDNGMICLLNDFSKKQNDTILGPQL